MYGLVPCYLHNVTTVDRVARQIEDPRGTTVFASLGVILRSRVLRGEYFLMSDT